MTRSRSLRYITILIALFLIFENKVGSQTSDGEVMGTVAGSVLDQSGAAILVPEPVIVFKGENKVTKVTVNENGRFKATLPSGTYEVTTEIPGFYPFRRAAFRVVGGASIMINLVPSRRYFVRGTTVSTKKGVDEKASRPRYEQFQITPKLSLPGLIQFKIRQNVTRQVRYGFAVFSHNHLTVYADEILFDPKGVRLAASGKNVILEDGQQRIEVKRVAVSFDSGEARLEVIRD
jgi:hypothetical protein